MSASTGGVRNLRAMFENKTSDQSTSPPSRGRSPSSSGVSGNSRPVSKVRASFVAVEKPGEPQQWGLRKTSDSMADLPPTSPHMSKESIDGGIGTILKGSSFDDTPKKEEVKTNGVGARAAEMVKKMQSKDQSNPPATKLKTTPNAQPVKNPNPKPIQPASPRSDKKSPKTPTSPAAPRMNIRGGPAKIRGVMESAKRASEAREAKKAELNAPIEHAKKENAPTEQAKKTDKVPSEQPKEASKPKPKPNGIQKDTTSRVSEPRSPAKATKLPAAVTAPTAASAAHQRKGSQPEAPKKTSRQSAAHLQAPRVANTATASSLAKKSSRASLANGNDRPKSRTSLGQPSESFLARMSRPTASSAQKTHEKAPVSPPRSRTVSNTKGKGSRMSLKGTRKSDGSEKESTTLEPTTETTEPSETPNQTTEPSEPIPTHQPELSTEPPPQATASEETKVEVETAS